MQQEKVQLKVVFVGSSGVGKTSIIQQYLEEQFTNSTQSTVGAMYFKKEVRRPDRIYDLHIWDTAGQERYKSMASLYYKDAHACICVCDVTDSSSYYDLRDWFNQINDEANKDIMVAGNKVDLGHKQKISEEMVSKFARDQKAMYQMTSAKDNFGVDEIFEKVVDRYVKVQQEKANQQQESGPGKQKQDKNVVEMKKHKDTATLNQIHQQRQQDKQKGCAC